MLTRRELLLGTAGTWLLERAWAGEAGGSGVSRRLALLSIWICFSVSRTDVRYSSILTRSGPLTLPRRSLAWERA